MKKCHIALFAIAYVGLILTGCTDAESGKRNSALSNKHKITMYSGGKAIGTWTSTGKPLYGQSNMVSFIDSATNHYTIVTGDCVVEVLPN